MNSRLLAVALLAGLAAPCAAAVTAPAASQAQTAVGTSDVYDGQPPRESTPVRVPPRRDGQAPADPERVAAEAQRQAAAQAPAVADPIVVPGPAKPALKTWNPLLNGAKAALLMGVAGFALGGPIGMLLGAAIGGVMAWGLTKIGSA